MPKPDLYVYLHLDPEKLLENIKKRGRSYEKNITADYLRTIQENYFAFFKQNTDLKYLVIDINKIDSIYYKSDYEKIIDIVFNKNYTIGINKIIL